jgi:phosphoglycolate phosphatase-like HAD superfamily hydrolase
MTTSAQPSDAPVAQELIDFKPDHPFFIGIDSDGCAFDSMEIKHKECFTPNAIKHFGLQPISKYAREAWEFTNLYSKWRGVNRFPALIKVLDLLEERDAVKQRGAAIPRLQHLRNWIEREAMLGNPALERAVADAPGDEKAELEKVLAWSKAVNETVGDLVHGVPPFPNVRECLEKAQPQADMVVVSATPCEALEREWDEHNIASFVRVIAGQEMGKKADILKVAAVGKYPAENILMIGDAPGDMNAAQKNGVLFYPIRPDHEEESWTRFREEALDKFFAGTFKGDYEQNLADEFLAGLPGTPPWDK